MDYHLFRQEKEEEEEGVRGVGVRYLHLLDKALLCKWNWRFTSEREAFWRQIICGKYREVEGDWCSNEARGGYGVGLWKAIRKL